MVLVFSDLRQVGVPYTREHINVMMERGEFPMARQLSPHRIGWLYDDIMAWIASRPAARAVKAA